MDNDDLPIGQLLTRRDALRMLGLTTAGFLVACRRPDANGIADSAAGRLALSPAVLGEGTCVAQPELEEGPFFVDEKLNRSDIRSDPATKAIKNGVPFSLAFVLSSITNGSCAPLPNAQIDIWHCDAQGNYSDENSMGMTTSGQKFLRGYQLSDTNGNAKFTTIYPGWYQGRTVHIHMKVRTKSSTGDAYEFTSQLFFDDSLSDRIFANDARYKRAEQRDTRNNTDYIFEQSKGQLLLATQPSGNGYVATFNLALDLSNVQVGKPDGGGRGGPGGRGGRGGPPPGGPGGRRGGPPPPPPGY